MHLRKGICFFLLAGAVFATVVALDQYHRDDLGKSQADGGAPPAPPIPWSATDIDLPNLNADGGAPPAPPIPWGLPSTESTSLFA